ncbi:hypothetical protein V492_02123 [Pseudogymnoascus sp. VKM F-4246]|nr:hypothetical protein V492_02123 [Pseudogymnoascus sp. VKM F-4246]
MLVSEVILEPNLSRPPRWGNNHLHRKPNRTSQLEFLSLMSHLANALRQITNKSSNPNALIYQIQLQRAKQKYLVQEQLGSGTGAAIALGAPESEHGKNGSESTTATPNGEQKNGAEAAEGNNEGIKCRESDSQPARAEGNDCGEGEKRR